MPTELTFQAIFTFSIGDHSICKGEALGFEEYQNGLYYLYRENDVEPIARLTMDDVNKLAGWNILPIQPTPLSLCHKEEK